MVKFTLIAAGVFMLGIIAGVAVVLATPLRFVNLVEPTITEISPADFYAAFNVNPDEFMFIDVRPQQEYKAEHPVGAVNMPLETLYNQRRYLPRHGKTIALICGGAQASGVAFSYLQHFGFLNLVRVTGGLPAWKAAGLPTVAGPLPNGNQTSSAAFSYASSRTRCT